MKQKNASPTKEQAEILRTALDHHLHEYPTAAEKPKTGQ